MFFLNGLKVTKIRISKWLGHSVEHKTRITKYDFSLGTNYCANTNQTNNGRGPTA